MRHRRWSLLPLLIALGASGCAVSYRGDARATTPAQLANDDAWLLAPVPAVQQRAEADCGAAALAMVVQRWQPALDVAAIARAAPPQPEGFKLGDLRDVARQRGLRAYAVVGDRQMLQHELAQGRAVVVGLHRPYTRNRMRSHYEVVVGLHRDGRVATIDPADGGWKVRSWDGLVAEWRPAGSPALVVLGVRQASATASAF